YARDDEAHHHPTVMRVAPPQVRLLLDAPQPLQTARPQPGGRALDRSGLEIDRHPQVRTDRYGETLVGARQPQLSFLGSQGNGEEVRPAGINLVDDMIAAHLVDRSEARGKRTYATQAAPCCVERLGGLRSDTLRAAKQENLQPAPAALGL